MKTYFRFYVRQTQSFTLLKKQQQVHFCSKQKFNDKTFSVLHVNVRSLNQNFESLKKLQTTIKFDYKAIFFTEIWCTDDPRNQTFFNLENYISINQVREHERGGGICVFIHNSLTFKLRSDLGTNSSDIESLVIEIINKKKQKCCHQCTVVTISW